MRVLAFDTATALTVVALRDITGAGVPGATPVDLERVDDPPAGARPGHARQLLALTHQLLRASGADWTTVDRIAVGVGPGTFTGLRIGVATGQGLAASIGKPLVGISTLRSLALGAHRERPDLPALAVVDARRNQAFVAGWRAGEDPSVTEPTLTSCVLDPDALVDAARGFADPLAIGDGAVKFREALERGGAGIPAEGSSLHRVSARLHCELALSATPVVGGRLEPQYLRVPDAELALR